MKIIKEFLENDSTSGEVAVLSALAPEIINFRPNFKGELRNTFILSPTASANFGFDICNGEAIIGVPSMLFNRFIKLRVVCVKAFEGRSGIYIIFQAKHRTEGQIFMALKLDMRRERVRILLRKRVVRFVEMKKDCTYESPSRRNSFDLAVHTVEKLEWE